MTNKRNFKIIFTDPKTKKEIKLVEGIDYILESDGITLLTYKHFLTITFDY